MNIDEALKLAHSYERPGKLKDAFDLYIKVLEKDPNNFDALYSLGVIVCELGNYDSAINLLKRAVAVNPTNAFAYHKLIIALDKNGNDEEMMKYYQNAIQLIPNFIDVVKKSIEGSRKGLWNSIYQNYEGPPKSYDDDLTMKKGAVFLNDSEIKIVEDWGCGFGGFKNYIANHQTYIGIDGSDTPFANHIVDLEEYKSKVDAVFMRHILEHNPNWERILKNAISSFEKKMVLILFTPFVEKTLVINQYTIFGKNCAMVDIAFRKEDITRYFSGINWLSEENLQTNTQYKIEHIFYLTKSLSTN
jgi:tetratricopeptide (TPR) repeat protein